MAPRQANADADLKREAILDLAASVLTRTRLRGYTTNAIAQAGGLSLRAIGLHVGTIQDATVKLVWRMREQLRLTIGLAVEPEVRGMLKQIVNGVVDTYARDPSLAELLLLEERRMQLADERSIQGCIRQQVRSALRSMPIERWGDPELEARYIAAIISGMSLESALWTAGAVTSARESVLAVAWAYVERLT